MGDYSNFGECTLTNDANILLDISTCYKDGTDCLQCFGGDCKDANQGNDSCDIYVSERRCFATGSDGTISGASCPTIGSTDYEYCYTKCPVCAATEGNCYNVGNTNPQVANDVIIGDSSFINSDIIGGNVLGANVNYELTTMGENNTLSNYVFVVRSNIGNNNRIGGDEPDIDRNGAGVASLQGDNGNSVRLENVDSIGNNNFISAESTISSGSLGNDNTIFLSDISSTQIGDSVSITNSNLQNANVGNSATITSSTIAFVTVADGISLARVTLTGTADNVLSLTESPAAGCIEDACFPATSTTSLPDATTTTADPVSPPSNSGGPNIGLIIGIVVGVLVLIAILVGVVLYVLKKQKKKSGGTANNLNHVLFEQDNDYNENRGAVELGLYDQTFDNKIALSSWTVGQIVQFVKDQDTELQIYAIMFRDNEINGFILSQAETQEKMIKILKDVGITAIGHLELLSGYFMEIIERDLENQVENTTSQEKLLDEPGEYIMQGEVGSAAGTTIDDTEDATVVVESSYWDNGNTKPPSAPEGEVESSYWQNSQN